MSVLYTILAGVADTTSNAASAVTKAAEDKSLFQILQDGGIIMLLLGILLLVVIVLGVERLMYLNKRAKLDSHVLSIVRDNLKDGKPESALQYCERTPTAQAQVLATGMRFFGSNMREIESAMETRANIELSAMEGNLMYVSLIARLAPMLGFLGTIFGVISIFAGVAKAGAIEIGAVSDGLNTKLTTSAGGLVVGIIGFIIYTLMMKRIDRYSEKLQEHMLAFLDLINRSGSNI